VCLASRFATSVDRGLPGRARARATLDPRVVSGRRAGHWWAWSDPSL